MFRRKKLLILIPTLLLIPLLLGMIPINMAHKLAQGGAFAQGSHGCSRRIVLLTPSSPITTLMLQSSMRHLRIKG